MAGAISLFVRFIHLVGMALLFGGAAYLWLDLRRTGNPNSPVTDYEWVFWGWA